MGPGRRAQPAAGAARPCAPRARTHRFTPCVGDSRHSLSWLRSRTHREREFYDYHDSIHVHVGRPDLLLGNPQDTQITNHKSSGRRARSQHALRTAAAGAAVGAAMGRGRRRSGPAGAVAGGLLLGGLVQVPLAP